MNISNGVPTKTGSLANTEQDKSLIKQTNQRSDQALENSFAAIETSTTIKEDAGSNMFSYHESKPSSAIDHLERAALLTLPLLDQSTSETQAEQQPTDAALIAMTGVESFNSSRELTFRAQVDVQSSPLSTLTEQHSTNSIQAAAPSVLGTTSLSSVSPSPLLSEANQRINLEFTLTNPVRSDVAQVAAESASTPRMEMTQTATKASWAPVSIDQSQAKWGEQMLSVLADRVSLQAGQNLQEARIRLDPPELGKLDLLVRVEGDKLNVQINASHVQTREALIQVSERLRYELQLQHFVDVNVDISQGQEQQSDASYQTSYEEEIQPNLFSSTPQSEATNHLPDHWLNTSA